MARASNHSKRISPCRKLFPRSKAQEGLKDLRMLGVQGWKTKALNRKEHGGCQHARRVVASMKKLAVWIIYFHVENVIDS
jgi:hypothetical protein